MAFKLQPATATDAPALAVLHTIVAAALARRAGRNKSTVTTEKGVLFALRHSKVFIAREGDEIVATLQLTTKKPWAIDTSYFTPCNKPLYLLAMAVVPGRQRQGIGTQCLKEAVRIARLENADALRLDAYDSPTGAGLFYGQCGFTERGHASYRNTPLIYYELLLR